MKSYTINEMFYSPQGEGVRAGIMHVFVRFAGCNMECREEEGPKSPGGFDCDTEFSSGRKLTLDQIHQEALDAMAVIDPATGQVKCPTVDDPRWLLLTGGEPALQVDAEFCTTMRKRGWKLAIETNGSVELPKCQQTMEQALRTQDALRPSATTGSDEHVLTVALGDYLFDWITVSPKVAEHAIRQPFAHEVKYVRAYGQVLPKSKVLALHKLISPAFDGVTTENIPQLQRKHLDWCLRLIAANPDWRLSVQLHKFLRVR